MYRCLSLSGSCLQCIGACPCPVVPVPQQLVPTAVNALNLTAPTVRKSVGHLLDLGLVRETTGKKRDRLFVFGGYLDILNQGTEPL